MTHTNSPLRAIRPMIARDPHEPHRAATPLELLFDLVTVIAIASAAAGLHHALTAAAALIHAEGDHFDIRFVHIALSALVITLAMWWLYFSSEEHLPKVNLPHVLTWGYGHAPRYSQPAQRWVPVSRCKWM